jgi:formylglycine-generating enzyme
MRITVLAVFLLLPFLTSLQAEMVKIPSGYYKPFIKTDSEVYQRPVRIQSFLIDKYPVTNREFRDFVSKNPKWAKEKVAKILADEGYLETWKEKSNPHEDSPVVGVSWFAAKAYCASKGKRLPYTAEWEYVAFLSPAGGNEKTIEKEIMKWYAEKKPAQLPVVGRYKNFLGVYDMHGLIWEWVYDFNSSSITGDSRADSDLESSLFCGAGALKANDFSNYAAYMRFGYRAGLKGWYTARYLGFRCAQDKDLGERK